MAWEAGSTHSRVTSRWALAAVAAVLGLLLPTAAAAQDEEPPCKVRANQAPAPWKGKALRPAITLKAEPPTATINFGISRGTKSFYVVLKASRRLPKRLKPEHIEISVPRPAQRTSETLEWTSIGFPTFSRPKFIGGRREIQFRVCIEAPDIKPGSYTSQIYVNGPKGLNAAGVATIVTAQAKWAFRLGVAVVLLAALILLVAMIQQDMASIRWWVKVIIIGGSLVTAGAAMYAIYAADPAWGGDPIASIIALGGTAFGAAGLGSFITTIFKQGGGTASTTTTTRRGGNSS